MSDKAMVDRKILHVEIVNALRSCRSDFIILLISKLRERGYIGAACQVRDIVNEIIETEIQPDVWYDEYRKSITAIKPQGVSGE